MPGVQNQWKAERERLAGELQRLEEALTDARSGSGDNEDGSLVSKLREATRKRVRIEEEFERSSDRWRDERRGLTEEIDQLDRALAKARAEARKNRNGSEADDSELRRQLNEAIETRQAIEKSLEKERAEWTSARGGLEEKVAKLELGLVEALERANNTSRSDEAWQAMLKAELETQKRAVESDIRSEFESALEDTQKAVQTLEDERQKLHIEIHRLQEAVGQATPEPAPAPNEPTARTSRFSLRKLRKGLADPAATTDPGLEKRIAELEARLSEQSSLSEMATRRAETAEAELAELEARRAAQSGDAASAASGQEAGTQTAAWDEERRQLTLRLETLEKELEGAVQNALDLEQQVSELKASSGTAPAPPDVDHQSAELLELQSQAKAWTDERESLTERVTKAEGALGQAEEKAAAAEHAEVELRAELDSRNTRISDLIAKADSDLAAWEEQRNELTARLQSLETTLEAAETQSSGHSEAVSGLESKLEASEAQLAEVVSRRQAESEEWSREREQLMAKASELEFSLKDTQSGQADITHQYEQLRTEFEEARRTANEMREQMGVDSREWFDEQKTLKIQVKELEASLKEARDADASADAKTRMLVTKLEEAEQKLANGSDQWNTERKKLEASVRELERNLRDSVENAAAERQKAEQEIAALKAAGETAATDLLAARADFEAQTQELEQTIAELRAASDTAKGALEAEVEAVRTAEHTLREQFDKQKQELDSVQASLTAREAQLEADLAEARQSENSLREQLEFEKGELIASKESLAARVEELEGSFDDAKRLNVSLEEAQSALASLEEETRARNVEWDGERAALETQVSELKNELKKLRKAQSEGKALTAPRGENGGSRTSVADLEARRQALEVRLLESEETKDELSATLKAATDEWESERMRLRRQLAEMDEAIESASKKEKAELDARHAELMEKLDDAESKYSSLEEQSLTSAKAWDEQRAQLEQEIAQWEQQVVAEAERVAAETKKALQEEYDMQLRELRGQKEQLEAQLQSGASSAAGVEADPAVINEEMARVDAEIDEINQLIEDPNAALSNVMRKNAERSELKAYRRGLSYLAERIAKESQAS